MLGKTARGLYWMFRYLERSENTARLVEAGFRIALTRPDSTSDEWASVIETAGSRVLFEQTHDQYTSAAAVDFLLRDCDNPSSVMSSIEEARSNGRLVRTALTREVWEATNECYLVLKEMLSRPLKEKELPATLALIRQQSALVRGTLHGTMMRNDMFDFARLGTFVERADNTSRILDVKYYVLLPSVSQVGSPLDNIQWETILRSVSAQTSFRWMNGPDVHPRDIAEFLITDRRMPRSLVFSYAKIVDNLGYLEADYGNRQICHDLAEQQLARLKNTDADSIFEFGVHEFLLEFIRCNNELGMQIEKDYRFYG